MSKRKGHGAEQLATLMIRSTAAFGVLMGNLLHDSPAKQTRTRSSKGKSAAGKNFE